MTESNVDRLGDALRRTNACLHNADGIRAEYVTRVVGNDETIAGFSLRFEGSENSHLSALLEAFCAPPPVRQACLDDAAFTTRTLQVRVANGGILYALMLDLNGWQWNDEHCEDVVLNRGFLPIPPGESELLAACPQSSRDLVNALLHHRLVQMGSSYCIQSIRGTVQHVALEFPWLPTPPFVAPLASLSRTAPVERIEIRPGERPDVYLAVSAAIEDWPDRLEDLQHHIARRAAAESRRLEDAVPALSPALPQMISVAPEIAAFDDASFEAWRPVLGPGMHFHFGLFDAGVTEPDDDAMTAALRRSITELFAFVPPGSTLYDVGCGWGGPLRVWTNERRCRAVGLTPSATQFAYVNSIGLTARYGDAEHTIPPGSFDCAVFLESLEYLTEKAALLQTMRAFVRRLLMRVNCAEFPIPATGLQMSPPSKDELRALLQQTGWRVVHWADRRRETLPTATVWKRRMQALPEGRDEHLDKLRRWADFVTANQEIFVRISPHIEVVADRA